MEEFKPTKIDLSKINDGKGKYNNGDGVQADSINSAIEASAWAQALGANQPNIENIDNVGAPSVSIETMADGSPRLKFENLKGEKGDKGEDADMSKVEKNTNKIRAVENALIQTGTIAKQNGTLSDEIQQTGGNDLAGLTILDGSYATVNKISGATVTAPNLFNLNQLIDEGKVIDMQSTHGAGHFKFVDTFTLLEFATPQTIYFKGKSEALQGVTPGAGIVVYVYTSSTTGDEAITFDEAIPFDAGTSENKSITLEDVTKLEVLVLEKDYILYDWEIYSEESYFAGLKHAQISGVKSIGKNLYDNYGVSTASNSLTAQTNSYGTTINSNDASKEVVVTQVANSSYGSGAYQNGFVFYYYTTPIEKQYDNVSFSFDLEITNNPLNITVMSFLSSYYKNVQKGIDGTLLNKKQRVEVPFTKKDTPSINVAGTFFEVRCGGMSFKISNVQISSAKATNPSEFEPYTESVMQLPQTIELGKWDYIENGHIVRQTIVEEFDSAKYNNGAYNGTYDYIISADGSQIAYKGTETSTPIDFDNKYLVWNKGIEQILTPKDDNGKTCFDYGANTTEENTYYIMLGGAK